MNNFPEIAQKKASEFILDKLQRPKNMAFVVNSLHDNEFAYKLVHSINTVLSKRYDIEISIFCSDKNIPILQPICPVYSLASLTTYDGPIVCCDFPTWQSSLSNYATKQYVYVYDVGILQKIPKELVKKINDSGYDIFSRSPKHNECLQKLGIKTIDKFLKDIDIEKMDFIYG